MHQIVRYAISLALFALLILHLNHVFRIGLLEQFENSSYDARIRATMPNTVDPRVVIVDIDERSLTAEGYWPWDRDKFAVMVKQLLDHYAVRAVGFDILFAEPQRSAYQEMLERLAPRPDVRAQLADTGQALGFNASGETQLAEAIRRVATVDGLVDRLRARAPEIPIRAIDDQVVGVEAHLRRVVTTADGGARQATIDTRWHHVAYVVGIEGAPLRYRAQFPAEALESLGVRTTVLHYNDPRLDAVLAEADAAIFYRVPATDRVLAAIDATRRRGAPTVFDVDDLIVDPGVEESIPALRMLPRDEADLWRRGIHRYRTTLEHCDAYSGSTTPLVDHVGRVVGIPAFVKDNHYGLHLARASDAALRSPRDPGPVRIGYFSGTTTHDEDLHFVTPALVSVLAAHPDVELWLGGHLPVVDALAPFADRVRRLPFVAWNELPALLRQIDINLAPLADDDVFNQSKSAIKWLEAALVATPTIATPTPPFADAITDGVTGVLAATPDAWGDALDSLVGDEARRRSLGARARRAALLEWSPAHAGRRVLAILDAAAAAPSRRSTWLDVTDPEPALASPPALTAYPPVEAGPGAFDLGVDGPVTPRGRRARARWVVSELRRRPARESMAAVARRLRRETGRAVRALRRRLG